MVKYFVFTDLCGVFNVKCVFFQCVLSRTVINVKLVILPSVICALVDL